VKEIVFPSFVHHYCEDEGGNHTFKGSLRRHTAIEKALYFLDDLLIFIGDAFPLYDLLSVPLIVGFGLNCNFPQKDVALYLVWYLKGCHPI